MKNLAHNVGYELVNLIAEATLVILMKAHDIPNFPRVCEIYFQYLRPIA